jgi:hypothetical protein
LQGHEAALAPTTANIALITLYQVSRYALYSLVSRNFFSGSGRSPKISQHPASSVSCVNTISSAVAGFSVSSSFIFEAQFSQLHR